MPIQDDIDMLTGVFCAEVDGFRVEFQYSADGARIGLKELFVPQEFRRQGIGRRFMNAVITILDEYGSSATVMASEKFGSTLERLMVFYGDYGFEAVGLCSPDKDGNRQWLMVRN